ncbi:MAG: heme ABC exporter ATP-binding protein CcmA [Sulfuricellaceae bacterium]|nr:heme ABC exporter ATP-binding protein CcmA [Sulfuricellaceae bacterium]
MPAIVVENLEKNYRHSCVLRDVCLNVEAGQCYVLFGANGAGKTTLLRILATIQRPSRGRFVMAGFDGVAQRDEVRQNLFLVTHGSHLYDELTGRENLRFALGLRGLHWDAQAGQSVLERVGLSGFDAMKVRHYSSGMKKRLAFAKAMLVSPPVLLLDEPYAALDERAMDMINQFVSGLTAEGKTVLMVSHNRHRSAQVAHRAGVLRRGGIDEISLDHLAGADELL